MNKIIGFKKKNINKKRTIFTNHKYNENIGVDSLATITNLIQKFPTI